MEVVLEGSDSIDSDWKEYNFRFKPGDISDRLLIACRPAYRLRKCAVKRQILTTGPKLDAANVFLCYYASFGAE